MTEVTPRFGFVALIGAPNAGKSTLVNALVGAKIAIVSHKVQTTRAPVRGIMIEGTAQVVLVDTPGLFAPRRRLDRAMVAAAWSGTADADRVLVLIDAKTGARADLDALFDKIDSVKLDKDLVLTKVDLVDPPSLLELAAKINARARFDKTFMVSGTTGSGVKDLARHLAAAVPEGPWHYPEDEIADAPARLMAAEVTREQIYARLHDELPYETTVETERLEEKKDGSAIVEQTIYVAREGQRKIVLGRGGATIKAISIGSRKNLSELLDRPIHLFLTVKVRENWGEEPERYERMGLEFPKGR